jgi:hypothetical protein
MGTSICLPDLRPDLLSSVLGFIIRREQKKRNHKGRQQSTGIMCCAVDTCGLLMNAWTIICELLGLCELVYVLRIGSGVDPGMVGTDSKASI